MDYLLFPSHSRGNGNPLYIYDSFYGLDFCLRRNDVYAEMT